MWHVLPRNSTTVQSQKAVSVYFTSKQILPFGIAEQSIHQQVQNGNILFRGFAVTTCYIFPSKH